MSTEYTGIVATDSPKRDNTPAPSGSHLARCVQIIDNGTSLDEFAGESRRRRTIAIGWEVYPEDEDGEIMANEQGEYFLVWENWTLSMNEKAKMLQRLESWRGKSLTPDERKRFEVGTLLDKPCRLSVIHNTADKGGTTRTYANVSGIAPATKRETDGLPDRGHDLVFFNINKPDMALFETFADWRKEKITHAEEWRGDRFVSDRNGQGDTRPVASTAPSAGEVKGCLTAHNSKDGTNSRGPWTSNRFRLDNGTWFGTMDTQLADRLTPAVGTGVQVVVELAQGEKGMELVDVLDAGDLQTQDGGWGGDEVL